MKCNVGKTDQIIRIIIGIAIITFGIIQKSLLGAIGLIPLLTGIFRWCGVYSLLKINTGAKDK